MTATFSRRQEVVHGSCRCWYDLRWPGGSMTVEVGPDAPQADVEALRVFRGQYPSAIHIDTSKPPRFSPAPWEWNPGKAKKMVLTPTDK